MISIVKVIYNLILLFLLVTKEAGEWSILYV